MQTSGILKHHNQRNFRGLGVFRLLMPECFSLFGTISITNLASEFLERALSVAGSAFAVCVLGPLLFGGCFMSTNIASSVGV
jgi:hypothetical protein